MKNRLLVFGGLIASIAGLMVVFDALGEAVVCVFTNNKWFVVANVNATIA